MLGRLVRGSRSGHVLVQATQDISRKVTRDLEQTQQLGAVLSYGQIMQVQLQQL